MIKVDGLLTIGYHQVTTDFVWSLCVKLNKKRITLTARILAQLEKHSLWVQDKPVLRDYI